MSVSVAVVWLLLAGASAQHWSYGLSPGGKRQLDGLPHSLDSVLETFPHLDKPCGVVDCGEVSPFAKIYRMKAFPGGVADRENEQRPYEK